MNKNLSKQNDLLKDLITIIEQGKQQTAVQVNSTMTLVFWQVGKRINEDILQHKRAAYGKQVVVNISEQLTSQYGRNFEPKNLRRMMQFASVFRDKEIVVTVSRQLSWSHFLVLIPIKNKKAIDFYAQKIAEENWGVRHTRRQIERKVYERQEIAKTQLADAEHNLQHSFKDLIFLIF